jgi:5-methylcytosine-specific restriction endonuclease McrA
MVAAKPLGTRSYQRLAQFVRRRDRNQCQICGSTDRPQHVDHIVPRHFGGPVFDPKNMRVLCRACNLIKGGSLMTDAEVLAARQVQGGGLAPARMGPPTDSSVVTRDYSKAG